MAGRLAVLDGRKTREAVFENEYPQRVAASDEDVDAKVKLEAVNDERLKGHKKTAGIINKRSDSSCIVRGSLFIVLRLDGNLGTQYHFLTSLDVTCLCTL